MSETKLKLKDPGTIHLMALDTSSLFLPFGRPITDYLRGEAHGVNGSPVLLTQGAIDFAPPVRWNDSLTALLRTTGFGELERVGLTEKSAAPAPAAPAAPPAEKTAVPAKENAGPTSRPAPENIPPPSAPRIPAAAPPPPRMTLASPPPAKAKPAVAIPPKPAAPAAAKAGPVVVPKAAPAPAVSTAAPVKAPTPAAAPPAKPPVAAPPAQARPVATPVIRVTVPQNPPAPAASALAVKAAATAAPPAPAARTPLAPPVPVKAPTPITSKPQAAPNGAPARPASLGSTLEQAREQAREVMAREIAKKEKEKEAALRERPAENITAPAPNLSITTPPAPSPAPSHLMLGEQPPESFFEKIPMAAKIGVALLVALLVFYFALGGKSSDKPAGESRPVAVGEQGWSTEWASDGVGSKRARQLTLYRPSAGMSDYQFQFVGQIESKALGWVFHAADTKNYYAMKIEQLRPGSMAITHFAVVEGRESSYSQKPIAVDARPGTAYRVKLDVTGPRFTAYLQGEPVEFWTDNRLKAGALGFMNERDERGVSSSVQFSFPKGGK